MSPRTPAPTPSRATSVSRVLWTVLALNLLVTAAKLAIGFTTGALAVVADGFHSLIDSSSNLVGLLGVWVAARPVDANHPYGHRRYETVATLGIGALLLAAAWEITRAIVGRLLGGAPPEITPITLVVVALTLPVNLAVVIYETRAARRWDSPVLLADATHTRSDLYVTLTVLASLAGGLLGLPWLDMVVAAAVVVIIVRAGLGIILEASLVLTDSVAADPQTVARIALDVPGVRYVHRIRSRGSSDAVQLDLHVKVDPAMTTSQAHGIASEVEHRLVAAIPNLVDTVVHIEPGRPETPGQWGTMFFSLRELAEGMGMGLHDLHVHTESSGSFTVELHLEFDAHLSLGEAHALADTFETRAKERWPQITNLVSHLEPLLTTVLAEERDPAESSQPRTAGQPGAAETLRQRIRHLADRICGPGACHNVELHRVHGHLSATLHVTLPAHKPLVQAHALAEEVERRILTEQPRLRRVVVHVEPPESGEGFSRP